MKKITLALACIGLMALSSCKKDRDCTCTYTDEDGDVSISKYTLTEISGKDAKDACSNYAYTRTSGSNTRKSTADCKLD